MKEKCWQLVKLLFKGTGLSCHGNVAHFIGKQGANICVGTPFHPAFKTGW